MYVSMNPKGETGKVIHISQNDTNREVEFIPFDQNGLTPLTDGQLTARINSIKGNTVSFNQLAQNGNFVDTSGWFCPNQTLSAENNVLTITINRTGINFYQSISELTASHKYFIRFSVKASKTMSDLRCRLYSSQGLITSSDSTINTSWGTQTFILETPSSFGGTNKQMYIYPNYGDTVSSGTVNLKNVVVIDLTLMGIDNLTTTAQVEEWLSSHIGNLPYYDYTQGTLIPFMGTGLKTTGKNLVDIAHSTYQNKIVDPNGILIDNDYFDTWQILGNQFAISYITKTGFDALRIGIVKSDGTRLRRLSQTSPEIINYPDAVMILISLPNNTTVVENLQVEFGSTATPYEPYTSNTLSLPTSTYFPTGMKDCSQTVYDEMNLTSGKGYERVGMVNLGTLDYTPSLASDETYEMFSNAIQSIVKKPSQNTEIANIKCAKYIVRSRGGSDGTYFGNDGISIGSNGFIFIYDKNYNTSSSASSLKDSLSNVYLYFELLTPTSTDISLDLTYPVWNGGTEQILPVNTSTPITSPIKANITYPDRTEDTEFLYKQTSFEWIYKSWAFVCKNITQALSVVGNALKGTIPGTMTSESGKFPLKVKMTDNDGVCFSEKIDLFVERKP